MSDQAPDPLHPKVVVMEPDERASCEVVRTAPDVLSFLATTETCDGFRDYVTMPLGRFLTELELTPEDCRRAIEEWTDHS